MTGFARNVVCMLHDHLMKQFRRPNVSGQVRIAARRQREIMAVIAIEGKGECAERIDEDYLELNLETFHYVEIG